MSKLKSSMSSAFISRISGSVVVATGIENAQMFDVVRIGELGLLGEIIRLEGDKATIQVYEDTTGLRPGEKVINTKRPLSIQLGPGLLTSIYDGIQRPLNILRDKSGDFISRGIFIPALDEQKKWEFIPTKKSGTSVTQGEIIGEVQETPLISHKVMVPYGVNGQLTDIKEGMYTVNDNVAKIKTNGKTVDVGLSTWWSVRVPRPVLNKLPPVSPLLTGQRVLDTFFPVAKGGTAAIPGPFGSGKTVTQQQLAKWADSKVIVYIGCGERGNEMTEILTTFPELEDPKSKRPLMERTILVANTSNMPVAAREASIYTGITIAEYFRDQGYHVALMADSTSRWGEALREVSSRLEEMPAEEGYPAYLATRLAEFYERAGAVVCLGRDERSGSVSIVGPFSPAGGAFSEPITQHSLRLAGTFWWLDTTLARQRHFPSINWNRSYTLYELDAWFDREVADGWTAQRAWALDLLQRESSLLEIVQLLGTDSLAPAERVVLESGRLLREDFLQQSAFDDVDAYCALGKQYTMLRVIRAAHEAMEAAIDRGVAIDSLADAGALREVARMRSWPEGEATTLADGLIDRIRTELE